MMNDNNGKKRPLTYYYMLMLVLILVFNSVIMPMFFNPKMKEVSYNNFLQMVDEGKVSKVEITDKRLAAVDKNNEKEIYVTGRVEDPELANRLMKSKVEFTQVVPKEQSPLVTFFTNWVLRFLFSLAWDSYLCTSGQAHGRQRHELRQEQCQGLCGSADRQKLCRCSRSGRG